MNALETAAIYYDASQEKRGDFSDVPLAEDFQFTGPVASLDSGSARSSTGRWRCPTSAQ
jgi:hypothetical protein